MTDQTAAKLTENLSLLNSSFKMSSSFLPCFAAKVCSLGLAAPKGFCEQHTVRLQDRENGPQAAKVKALQANDQEAWQVPIWQTCVPPLLLSQHSRLSV